MSKIQLRFRLKKMRDESQILQRSVSEPSDILNHWLIQICPFSHEEAPCGTWCPLFHYEESQFSLHCGGVYRTSILEQKGGEQTKS